MKPYLKLAIAPLALVGVATTNLNAESHVCDRFSDALINVYKQQDANYNSSVKYISRGNENGLIRTLETQIKLDNDERDISNALSNCMKENKDYNLSLEINYFEISNKESLNQRLARSHYTLGMVHLSAQNFGYAKEHIEKASILDPKNKEYNNILKKLKK